MAEMTALESAYLRFDDPLRRSGFGGGLQRWVEERSPLLGAIDRDGTFLDVGCANGLLAADVVAWAEERGRRIVPFGIDLGRRLVDDARRLHPADAAHFMAADAWTWEPDRSWDFVFSLLELSPADLTGVWLRRLAEWVAPGGRLVVGSYGSRSRGISPRPVAAILAGFGYRVAGSAAGGTGPVTRFAWAAVEDC